MLASEEGHGEQRLISTTALVVHSETGEYAELRKRLEECGLTVAEADTGIRALALAELDRPGLVIVEYALPDMSGPELCRRIQTIGNTPTLLVGAPDGSSDEKHALRDGPTECLKEPMNSEQIAARATRLLGVAHTPPAGAIRQGRILEVGDLTLDLQTNTITLDGSEVCLPPTQVNLLRMLMERSPRVASTEALALRLWPKGYHDHSALADVIMRLRVAIEDAPTDPSRIIYVPDYGYKLVPARATPVVRTISRN